MCVSSKSCKSRLNIDTEDLNGNRVDDLERRARRPREPRKMEEEEAGRQMRC